MDESQGWFFEPTFNRSVEVGETDERITSDRGVLLLREADHRLGPTEQLVAWSNKRGGSCSAWRVWSRHPGECRSSVCTAVLIAFTLTHNAEPATNYGEGAATPERHANATRAPLKRST
jgi:hypothetical protein